MREPVASRKHGSSCRQTCFAVENDEFGSYDAAMNTPTSPTRVSLIEYLQQGDENAWHQFDHTYRPVITRWLRSHSIQPEDAEDIAQEVLTAVSAKVADFDHNGRVGAFRNWLRSITINTLQNSLRKSRRRPSAAGTTIREIISQLEDPASEMSRQFDVEHNLYILNRLLSDVSSQFQPETIEAFRLYVLEDVEAQEVAERTGVGTHAVYMAKSRVLRALRTLAPDWIDELSVS